MKGKNKYRVDNSNRLVIGHKPGDLTCDGSFALDKNNRLLYWLNEPSAWRKVYCLPSKIRFEGKWHINKNYDLELVLSANKYQSAEDSLVIKGEIISTDRDALTFEFKSYDKKGMCHIRLLKLSGSWGADEYNRIIFAVKRQITPDLLFFEGIWQITRNQEIVYSFEKTDLKRKTRISRALIFKGFWQIDRANQLSYVLEHSSVSRFDFRCQLESLNLRPKESAIKYRLGIGMREQKAHALKTVSLYGTWKFSRNLGLSFQMDYGKGRVRKIEFGGNIYLSGRDEAVFSLATRRGEPLGMCVTFTHRFLRKSCAEALLRLKRLGKESAVETGVSIPF